MLQAVVRGAVDQSVECALGTGQGGPAGHGAALVDRGSGGGGDHRGDERTRGVSQSSIARAIDDDADSARTSPAVSPLYPAPFVPASDIDLDAPGEVVVDEATHVPDAGVLEDASHLYSMVRDALRVQT